MPTQIHPTAIVSPRAELGDQVEIGPYAVVEAETVVGEGTIIGAHAVVKSHTTIGPGCRIYPHACLGGDPQDLHYAGQPTKLILGQGNIVREFATLNRGTEAGGGLTRIGDHNMLMAYSHVAHDCQVGSHVVMANSATLAGHVIVQDYAFLSAMVGVHQFCRIGAHAFVGGITGVERDVPPFCMALGQRARLYGLNVVGLKRRGFSSETIRDLKEAYRTLFRNHGGVLAQNLIQLEAELGEVPEVKQLIDFIRTSERGICR